MDDLDPTWWRVADAGKAHLRRGTGPTGPVAWCGMNLDGAVRSIGGPQCALCLRALRAFTDKAVEEMPDVVTETVLVQVTRPSHSREDLADIVTRKLSARRTWQVVVKPYPEGDA